MGPILDCDKKCSRDPWAARFAAETGGFSSKLAFHRLLMLALILLIENSTCEMGFSVLRRLLALRVQTHKLSMTDLISDWLGHSFRTGGPTNVDLKREAAAQAHAPEEKRPPCSEGWTGGWAMAGLLQQNGQ